MSRQGGISSSISSRGGKARMAALSATEKTELAEAAAAARWKTPGAAKKHSRYMKKWWRAHRAETGQPAPKKTRSRLRG